MVILGIQKMSGKERHPSVNDLTSVYTYIHTYRKEYIGAIVIRLDRMELLSWGISL